MITVPVFFQQSVVESLKKFDTSEWKNSEKRKLENLVNAIAGISDTSIKESYKAIYNQTCILAVSASSVLLEKYFTNYLNTNWKTVNTQVLNNIKVSLGELGDKYKYDLKSHLGEVVLDKGDSISFQDLQSIKRTFEKYLDIKIEIDNELEKKIIFYHHCRHVLVHKKGVIDQDFVDKVASRGANLKNYKVGDCIELSENDWEGIKDSFSGLVKSAIPTAPVIESKK